MKDNVWDKKEKEMEGSVRILLQFFVLYFYCTTDGVWG